jgi:hypothetical protein
MNTKWTAATATLLVKIATALATIIVNTIAPVGEIAKRLGAGRHTPAYPDHCLSRYRRRRARHSPCAVEHAVIDQWLIWRN